VPTVKWADNEHFGFCVTRRRRRRRRSSW
jgi:hypothetical protein